MSSTDYQKVTKCCWEPGHTKDGFNEYYGYFADVKINKFNGFRDITYEHETNGIIDIEEKINFIKTDIKANMTFRRFYKGDE